MARKPFWRVFHLKSYHGDYVPGVAAIMFFDDGSGLRPVTDIEWIMWSAFRQFDAIMQDAHSKLDQLFNEASHNQG